MKSNKNTVFVPIYVILILLLLSVSSKLLAASLGKETDFFFSAVIIQIFVYMIPVAFYCKFRGLEFIKASKCRPFAPSDVSFAVLCMLVYFSGMMFLCCFKTENSEVVRSVSGLAAVYSEDKYDSAFIALCYVIIPAISEEMLFRSVIISELEQFGGTLSVIVSAIFFAMIHFSFADFFMYFTAGLIFGLMTYVTGSSVPAVILHMLSNFVNIYLSNLVDSFIVSGTFFRIFPAILAFVTVLFAIFMFSSLEKLYIKRETKFNEGTLRGSRLQKCSILAKAGNMNSTEGEEKNSIFKEKSGFSIFISPTFLLSVTVFILLTLYMH